MATSAYLKAAASNLLQAANALQQEAKQLRAEHMHVHRDKTAFIDKNHLEIKAKEAELGAVDNQTHQSRLAHEIQQLRADIQQTEHELQHVEQRINEQIRAKLSKSDSIAAQARDLEMQAGAPEFA